MFYLYPTLFRKVVLKCQFFVVVFFGEGLFTEKRFSKILVLEKRKAVFLEGSLSSEPPLYRWTLGWGGGDGITDFKTHREI